MPKIKIAYLGFEGVGRTLKLAKEAAVRMAEAFIKDASLGAKVVQIGKAFAVISRTLGGWQYQMIWPDGSYGTICSSFDDEDGRATENRARLHAAQILCIIPEDSKVDLITSESGRKEHMSWFNWQCRYKEAKEAGYSDEDARYIASGTQHLTREKAAIAVPP